MSEQSEQPAFGKKGAIYSLPQKLAVTAISGRRLRCKWAGDSGLGRRYWPGSGPAGSLGHTGDSGPEGRRLRCFSGDAPDPYPVPHHKDANELRKPEAGDSGSLGPETPVGRRLRTISGVPPDPSPVAHHTKTFGSEKRGTRDFGPEGRRLRCDRRLRTIFGPDPNSENRTPELLQMNSVFDNLGLVGIITSSTTRLCRETS